LRRVKLEGTNQLNWKELQNVMLFPDLKLTWMKEFNDIGLVEDMTSICYQIVDKY
jgi:hypothetical protein